MEVIFSQHALQQMFKRNISIESVKKALFYGTEIKGYPNDKPYPSKLMLEFENGVPLHVVVAINLVENKYIVVTAYNPDSDLWSDNFKTRK